MELGFTVSLQRHNRQLYVNLQQCSSYNPIQCVVMPIPTYREFLQKLGDVNTCYATISWPSSPERVSLLCNNSLISNISNWKTWTKRSILRQVKLQYAFYDIDLAIKETLYTKVKVSLTEILKHSDQLPNPSKELMFEFITELKSELQNNVTHVRLTTLAKLTIHV